MRSLEFVHGFCSQVSEKGEMGWWGNWWMSENTLGKFVVVLVISKDQIRDFEHIYRGLEGGGSVERGW